MPKGFRRVMEGVNKSMLSSGKKMMFISMKKTMIKSPDGQHRGGIMGERKEKSLVHVFTFCIIAMIHRVGTMIAR